MKPIKSLSVIILFLSLVCCITAADDSPYLSRLSAKINSPLYTTYAASMERSEFTLDEGYHFQFYDSNQGADFITDTAGNWCLGFKRDGDFVYELKDLFQEPVITLSYPDMVKYFYYPFEDLRVEVTFFVYSSHEALQDIVLRCTGDRSVELEVIPFLTNDYRIFNNIRPHPENNAMSFTHEELPDSWVLEQKIPFVERVQDVFILSKKPDRMTSYHRFRRGNITIPHQVDLGKKPRYVVWGKRLHEDGERCPHLSPKSAYMVTLNSDLRQILTETAPRWGSSDQNINPYGFYWVELGSFEGLKEGDEYTMTFSCVETGENASFTGNVEDLGTEDRIRKDIRLSADSFPQTPSGLKLEKSKNGAEIRLYWKHTGEKVTYHIYRRNYKKSGVYKLLAEKLSGNLYSDKNISSDQIYGYVVVAVDEQGQMSMHSEEITDIAQSDFLTDIRSPDRIKNDVKDLARVIAMPTKINLSPGGTESLRIIRAVAPEGEKPQRLITQAQLLFDEDLDIYIQKNEKLFSRIPRLKFDDPEKEMLYWSAFNLMRQVMLPPEGKCGYNYYVFSREPTWGWGHGGQVFHESLTMLAYVFMDPQSAMDSQRVYRERQNPEGYINYRTGPFLDETIPTAGELTSSAPWYAWQNWEIFKITKDREFLKEMYSSSKAFYEYYVSRRDKDGDGLCEWGAHAVLESVRDASVAVWDEVAWATNFEAIDLNCMLVQEAKSLEAMAAELGFEKESQLWRKEALIRQKKINDTMWDEETGFYFNVDKKDHDFSFKNQDDLKREEIIGFLPLWAGVASKQQAKKLIHKLTNTNKFWRKYGVPTLAADDSYYNSKGYWNGPIWVEWNYLVLRGLIQYGYRDLAEELVSRVAANMIAQLKKDHQLWEFYSPDERWAGYHRQYIWAGCISRMMMDVTR